MLFQDLLEAAPSSADADKQETGDHPDKGCR
jgi:hypothetical protein